MSEDTSWVLLWFLLLLSILTTTSSHPVRGKGLSIDLLLTSSWGCWEANIYKYSLGLHVFFITLYCSFYTFTATFTKLMFSAILLRKLACYVSNFILTTSLL